MKRILRLVILPLAVLLVFEEWLWDGVKVQLRRLGSLRFFRWLEGRLRQLGPWASLAVLAFPAVVLFPFKLAALWALSRGHTLVGVAVLVAAKLVGTAVAAYLFDIVRDRARELRWFDSVYTWIIMRLDRAKVWLRAQPAYQAARLAVARLKTAGGAWARRVWAAGRPGGLRRKLRAAKAIVRSR